MTVKHHVCLIDINQILPVLFSELVLESHPLLRIEISGNRVRTSMSEDDAAEITRDLQVTLGHLLAEGDDDGASGTG